MPAARCWQQRQAAQRVEEFFAGLGDDLTRSMDGCYSWGLDSLEAAWRLPAEDAAWPTGPGSARRPACHW